MGLLRECTWAARFVNPVNQFFCNERIPQCHFGANVLGEFDCHHSHCQMPNSWRLVLNLVHVLRFWT